MPPKKFLSQRRNGATESRKHRLAFFVAPLRRRERKLLYLLLIAWTFCLWREFAERRAHLPLTPVALNR